MQLRSFRMYLDEFRRERTGEDISLSQMEDETAGSSTALS